MVNNPHAQEEIEEPFEEVHMFDAEHLVVRILDPRQITYEIKLQLEPGVWIHTDCNFGFLRHEPEKIVAVVAPDIPNPFSVNIGNC